MEVNREEYFARLERFFADCWGGRQDIP
jgi:hypothetical protein